MVIMCLPLIACQQADQLPADVSRDSPVVPLDTGQIKIVTEDAVLELSVEIAETAEQRRIGLMGRKSLPQDEGMLFLYAKPRPGSSPFYMFRTLIPLDIAFFDAQGNIVAILQMQPCDAPVADDCKRYPPGVPYRGALEVNQGLFAAWGVKVGDRVELVDRREVSAHQVH